MSEEKLEIPPRASWLLAVEQVEVLKDGCWQWTGSEKSMKRKNR
jgi:hypothetical protein